MRTIANYLTYTIFIVALVTLGNASYCCGQAIDVFVGTGGNDGIFHLTLDAKSGKLSEPKLFAKVDGSGFLAWHPSQNVIYSTMKKGKDAGVVSLNVSDFRKWIKADDQLKSLNTRLQKSLEKLGQGHPNIRKLQIEIKTMTELMEESDLSKKQPNFISTGDGGAACVGTDRSGKALFSAQYGGGSTTSYSLADDGTIVDRVSLVEHGPGSSVDKKRQAKSHPHWVGTSPDNRFLMVPDLGKDAVVIYSLDPKTAEIEKHSEAAVPPGSGPRHMKFHQSGKHVYVLNELTLTISVFEYDAQSATFKSIQVIETLPNDEKDKHLNSAAEIRIHPNGKFIYSSNRGHDSISVFSVDPSSGELTFVQREHIRGSWPRNFNLDPSGKWLIAAGQYSNTLSLFEIDQESGELTFTRKCVNVPKPICVLFGK